MKTRLFVNLLFIVIITSCAGTGEQLSLEQRLTDMNLQIGEGNVRIPRYRVNGWTPIDNRNLIITAGVSDKYLVRLSFPCLGLDGAFQIGFTTPMGSLDRFESLLVRSLGRGRERCDIQDIFQLEKITN